MERWKGRVAIVTGASRGIGLSITEALARNGMIVIACARNIEDIQELQRSLPPGANDIRARVCDASKEEDILCLFRDIEASPGYVDVLVNNVGVAPNQPPLADSSTFAWRDMLNLNVLAGSVFTRGALRLMEHDGRNAGNIININSTYGSYIRPGSGMSFYAGTKHMLTALSKALNAELRQKKSKVRVTNLSPSVTRTSATEKSLHLFGFPPLEPQDVSQAVLFVLSAPPHVNIRQLSIASTESPIIF
ncbi:hypothetical protein RvY_18667 [Ramazzottius varieornatus]|uniref:Dehydrogenase/reductase SDR family member 11 n=1 Tax=Ramazzottius varieornatus TaxID=947166 RepID=A0A1D1WBK7_RAMVA|nr:hypothetical protein RvY_18667 [Ramazzottius varieornatus]